MPNNCLSVLYKRIIQVENKNVGLKVGGGGTNIPLPPQSKKWGGHAPLAPPPPASYASDIYIYSGYVMIVKPNDRGNNHYVITLKKKLGIPQNSILYKAVQ